MNNADSFFKKIFNGKSKKSIISIVALIQCVILVVLTAYSWIESQNSLVIKGDDLPIADNVYYRFNVSQPDDGSVGKTIDLSSFFRPTALFQLSQASSYDAKEFYFPTKSNNSGIKYRRGDTTDYNTSYYNIDFLVNSDDKTYNFYFENHDIFTVSVDSTLDNYTQIQRVLENAMRISVGTVGDTSAKIFSETTPSPYNAVVDNEGTLSTNNVSVIGLEDSDYVLSERISQDSVFTSVKGDNDTYVNVKIWFEEQDPGYQDLVETRENDLTKILGATVKINLAFVNASSLYHPVYFDDYTMVSVGNDAVGHLTTENTGYKMQFVYNDGSTESRYPMINLSDSYTGNKTSWATAEPDSNEVKATVPQDVLQEIINDNSKGYFLCVDSSGNEIYRWPISTPESNGGRFCFKALSYNKTSANTSEGYGVWDSVPIKLWYFKDQTSGATTDPYNAYGYQFINKATTKEVYISSSTSASNNATKLFYDAKQDLYKGYYIALDADTAPVFSYIESDVFNDNNIKVQWVAEGHSNYGDEISYKALGYQGTNVVSNQKKAVGVGTWTETEQILLSTELIDASVNKDYRYKIGIKSGNSYKYYYMTKHKNALTWGAYVPINAGKSANDHISFQHFNSVSNATATGTWSSTDRDNRAKFYAIDMKQGTSKGQWHIGVVVDGSADNVVNDVLSNVPDSKLEYSINGGADYIEMTKLDDHRWYTQDLDVGINTIIYRWTAYPSGNPNYNEAVFSYGHSFEDGIYFNITE